MIDTYLAEIPTQSAAGRVYGVIAPHAGHIYSGSIAARAFCQFRGLTPTVVAVLAPLHQPHTGQLFTSGHSAYATPLGTIPIAAETLQLLDDELKTHDLHLQRLRNDHEHAVEIELPFLQRVLKQPFQLLPIMIGEQTIPVCRALGSSLGKILRDTNALLVGSSDLSHFYPASTAQMYDNEMLARIEAFDAEGVIQAEEKGLGYACGRGAVAASLWAARDLGANNVQLLGYAHSGQVSGDISSVVGYGAAVIYAGVQQAA